MFSSTLLSEFGQSIRSLQAKLRLGLALSCLVIAILTPQIVAALVPNTTAATTHAVTTPAATRQTALSPFTWRDVLSGGLWARANNLESNTTILNATQASAAFGSLTPSGSAPQVSTSMFASNFRVTGNSSLFPLEDEPSIAVTNQSGHVLMVVGANSLSTGRMVAYVSRDQGTHWIGPSLLALSRPSDGFASDPALSVNRTGTFYYAFLSIGQFFFSSSGVDDLVVATSQDGGNWTNHVAAQRRAFNSSNSGSELFDKPYIAVGPSKSNPSIDAVYATYTDFLDYCSYNPTYTCYENTTIMQVHSTDNGVTWSHPTPVSPTFRVSSYSLTGRIVQGSMPAVAPNGDLYVAYYDSGKDGWLNASANVMITKSTNGGVSFSPPTLAALIPQQLSFASLGNFCCFRWWSSMFPSMDVAPDGTVYIAYGARQSKVSPDPADVYLVVSRDGVTWTQPRKINDDSTQNGQFFAWLKVSSDGVVHIIWGDQRLDPAGIGYDIFYAEATNHGTTISINSRVTDVGTDPLFTIGFIGDYFNMAVSGNQVYPVWTDGRRAITPLGRYFLVGETDIFTARLGPRDTPSLTTGPSAPAGYLAPITISGSGLPREAFFLMKINGIGQLSQNGISSFSTNGIIFFFSTKQGTLSNTIVPSFNSPGAYTVELDEWVSGAPVATTTLYIVDTRPLQVLVAGPSTASQGDTVTWNLQLVPAGGSTGQSSFSSTFSVTEALLTSPSGSVQNLTASVKPTGTGSYSLTTSLSTSEATGSYTLFVSGSQTVLIVQSSGIGTATLMVSHAVSDFSLATSPTSVIVSAGVPGTSTITVSPVGIFAGTVTLTSTVSSASLTCTLGASSLALGASQTSTLSCSGPPGVYAVTVAATSGSLTHTATVPYTVQDFTVTASLTDMTIASGGSGASTITVGSINGFSGTVELTTSVSPAGLTAKVSPASVLSLGSSTITVSSSTIGTYTVTVTGTAGGLTHTATVTVTVGTVDFSVTASPSSISTSAGSTATSTITVTNANGLTGTVGLTQSVSPATGLDCSLSTSSTSLGVSASSILSCTGSPHTYTVTITGTAGQTSHSTTLTITVNSPPDFILTASPTSLSTSADSTATSTITVISVNGFTGAVDLTQAISSATGLDCSLSTSRITLGVYASSILSCTGSPQTYTVTVTGTAGQTSHSTALTITVKSAPPTILGVSPVLFYGSTGGILAALIIAIVGALLALRQRQSRPKTVKAETSA